MWCLCVLLLVLQAVASRVLGDGTPVNKCTSVVYGDMQSGERYRLPDLIMPPGPTLYQLWIPSPCTKLGMLVEACDEEGAPSLVVANADEALLLRGGGGHSRVSVVLSCLQLLARGAAPDVAQQMIRAEPVAS